MAMTWYVFPHFGSCEPFSVPVPISIRGVKKKKKKKQVSQCGNFVKSSFDHIGSFIPNCSTQVPRQNKKCSNVNKKWHFKVY